MAIGFNLLNGYLNGTGLQMNTQKYAAAEWYWNWQFQVVPHSDRN
jgi:hypothetical protein